MAEGRYREGRERKKKSRGDMELSPMELELQNAMRVGRDEQPSRIIEAEDTESVPVETPAPVVESTTIEPKESKSEKTKKQSEANKTEYDSFSELKEAIQRDPSVPQTIKDSLRFTYHAKPSREGEAILTFDSSSPFGVRGPLSKYRKSYERLVREVGATESDRSSWSSVDEYAPRPARTASVSNAVSHAPEHAPAVVPLNTKEPSTHEAEVPLESSAEFGPESPAEWREKLRELGARGSQLALGSVSAPDRAAVSAEVEPQEIGEISKVRVVGKRDSVEAGREMHRKMAEKTGLPWVEPSTVPTATSTERQPVTPEIKPVTEEEQIIKPTKRVQKIKELITEQQEKIESVEQEKHQQALYEKYTAQRQAELDEKLKKFGPWAEAFIRSQGEKYNSLSRKHKIAIGVVLGLGVVTFSGVLPFLAKGAAAGLAVQRFYGMAGMYTKIEKHLQNTFEGTARGYFATREWYKKIADKPETQRKLAAAVMAMSYTVGMSAAIREGVQLASESSYGEAVHDWLRHYWSPDQTPSATETSPLPTPDIEPTPEPQTVELAVEVAPTEMPTVGASKYGYEGMLKNLLKKLPDTLPQGVDSQSDLAQLIEAKGNPQTIDTVVHKIAQAHKFYTEEGSVRIGLKDHMTIDSHGQVVLNDAVEAPKGASFTPEAPKSPVGGKMPSVSEQEMTARVEAVAQQDLHDTTLGSLPSEAQEAVAAGTSPVEVPAMSENFVINSHNVTVDVGHANSYVDAQDNIIVYGGSVEERAQKALDIVAKDHKAVVYFDSTQPKGIFGFLRKNHLSKAYWLDGSGTTADPTNPVDVSVNQPVIVDDTVDKTLPKNLPGINDLAGIYKPKH